MGKPQRTKIDLVMRPDSGAMVFRGDWPGLFLRGDTCVAVSIALEDILMVARQVGRLDPFTESVLEDLLEHINKDVMVRGSETASNW